MESSELVTCNTTDKLREQLIEGKSLNAFEHICTVNENNVATVKGDTRRNMRLNHLWHRATFVIIIFGDDDHLLIQKRSNQKDYFPSSYDPTPGGVVEFGESYKENVKRELLEEMNINIEKNPHKRLFSFKYENDIVRCWGDLWEVKYKGLLKDIRLQESEVEEVLHLSISAVKNMILNNRDDWMPDGLYALELYLQYLHDIKFERNLIGVDFDSYKLRPKIEAVFFDCDDCLYFDNWNVASQLTNKIDEWCMNHGLKSGEAYQLYKKYGTALRGLITEGYLPNCEQAIDKYLEEVHDIPIHSLMKQDVELRSMLLNMNPSIPKYIFTASVRHHAQRCLEALGIQDLFIDIIDVKACDLATKHSKEAFLAAMKIGNVTNPQACILLDDSISNIDAAHSVGWRSVLVGSIARDCKSKITSQFAEHQVERIHDLPTVYPEWFNTD